VGGRAVPHDPLAKELSLCNSGVSTNNQSEGVMGDSCPPSEGA